MFYLDDWVQEDHARFLGDDLLGCVMMFDKLRDCGESSAFETVLILRRRKCRCQQDYFYILQTSLASA